MTLILEGLSPLELREDGDICSFPLQPQADLAESRATTLEIEMQLVM